MKEKKKTSTHELTVIKHYEMYLEYKNLHAKLREQYPEIYGFIANGYYYELLVKKYHLTPNYVCSIICNVMMNEDFYKKIALRARMDVE